MITLLIILIWLVIGTLGFIYWWTTEFEFEKDDIMFSLFMGLIGPMTWIAGYFIHKDK